MWKIHRYTLRKSVAAVMRLQMGQSLVEPRQRSQHPRQQVCQQPVETVGSVYGSRQILHDIEDAAGVVSCDEIQFA